MHKKGEENWNFPLMVKACSSIWISEFSLDLNAIEAKSIYICHLVRFNKIIYIIAKKIYISKNEIQMSNKSNKEYGVSNARIFDIICSLNITCLLWFRDLHQFFFFILLYIACILIIVLWCILYIFFLWMLRKDMIIHFIIQTCIHENISKFLRKLRLCHISKIFLIKSLLQTKENILINSIASTAFSITDQKLWKHFNLFE